MPQLQAIKTHSGIDLLLYRGWIVAVLAVREQLGSDAEAKLSLTYEKRAQLT